VWVGRGHVWVVRGHVWVRSDRWGVTCVGGEGKDRTCKRSNMCWEGLDIRETEATR